MPRNVLAIPAKTSPLASTAFSKALREHIHSHFTDTHPDAFADDLKSIARLRDAITHSDVHVASIEAAQKYYAQLVFMCTKFPADINLAFPWTVAFPPTLSLFSISLGSDESPDTEDNGENAAAAESSSAPAKSYTKTSGSRHIVAHPDLHYERAAVLFSLASLYSAIGASEPRSEGESIKRAIAAFQAAAGVLQHLLAEVIPMLTSLWAGTRSRYVDADLQPAMLACLRDSMLAQAQECFWQKAVVDRLKDATIARLASRVSELYASALDYATTGGPLETSEDGFPRGCELPKEWTNHMTIKRWHFAAAAQFRKSTDDLAANRYGDELGRLKVAEGYVRKALESSRSKTSDALQADLKSLQNIIQTNLARGTKDNDLIYLQPVTAASSLAPIPSAAMVDAKLPQEVASPIPLLREGPAPAFGRPLFQELVPYGVHVAISIFDDRKETFVREEIDLKREELDSLATSTLQSLDLPGSLQALEQPEGLPPTLVRKSDEIRSEGGLERLKALSGDVQRVAHASRDVWHHAAVLVKQLPQLDGGASANGLPPYIAERNRQQSGAYASQVDEYRETIEQAARSDDLVQQKIKEWRAVIEVLARGQDALENYVPGQKRSVSMDSKQSAAVRALRVELEALDDLMDSRTSICEEARQKSRRHDIRPEVMREAGILASGGAVPSGRAAATPLTIEAAHFEPLFERELNAYDSMRREMQANEAEQERLLEAIAARNEDFVQARRVDATVQRRQEALQTLDMGHAKYREVCANLVEGLKFYNELIKMLTDLRMALQNWTQQCQAEITELAARREEHLRQQQPVVAKPKAKRRSGSRAAGAQPEQSEELAGQSPARRTRAQVRAEQAQSQPPPQPPSWGAWQGGDIQFAD